MNRPKTFDFDTQSAVSVADLTDTDEVHLDLVLRAEDHRLLVTAVRRLHRRMIRCGDPQVVSAAALLDAVRNPD